MNEWYYGTPLWYAAGEGRTDVVRLLIDRGANLNTMNKKGDSALEFAALKGHTDIVKILIDAGADVDAAVKGIEKQIADSSKPNDSVKVPDFPLPGVAMVNIIGDMQNNVLSDMDRKNIAEWKEAIDLIRNEQTNVSHSKNITKAASNFSGRKTYTSADGGKYEGDFVDGKAQGKGTSTFANGNKYKGDFVNNKRNGKGTYTYVDGDKYEGDFVGGKFTSRGEFTCSNGKQFTGNLENIVPKEFITRCN